MANREIIRKLTVTGKGQSYYVTLPKDIIKDLNWRKGEKKIVSQAGKKIVIEDWSPPENSKL